MSNNETQGGLHKSVINWYPGHMVKTKRQIKEKLSLVDIIVHVIDSRIPKSSFVKDIDDFTGNKEKIILLFYVYECFAFLYVYHMHS